MSIIHTLIYTSLRVCVIKKKKRLRVCVNLCNKSGVVVITLILLSNIHVEKRKRKKRKVSCETFHIKKRETNS